MMDEYISPIDGRKNKVYSYEELIRPLSSDCLEAMVDKSTFIGRYYKEVKKRGAMMKAVIIKDGRELFNAHGDTLTKLIINLIEINEDRKGDHGE